MLPSFSMNFWWNSFYLWARRCGLRWLSNFVSFLFHFSSLFVGVFLVLSIFVLCFSFLLFRNVFFFFYIYFPFMLMTFDSDVDVNLPLSVIDDLPPNSKHLLFGLQKWVILTPASTNFRPISPKLLVNNLKNDSFWHHTQSIQFFSIRKNTPSWKWRWFRPISPNFWLIIWKIGHFEIMPNRFSFFQFVKIHHRENDQFLEQLDQKLGYWFDNGVILTPQQIASIRIGPPNWPIMKKNYFPSDLTRFCCKDLPREIGYLVNELVVACCCCQSDEEKLNAGINETKRS